MSFLLDTNICSGSMRRERDLFSRFLQHSGGIYISRIAIAEFYAGAYGVSDTEKFLEQLEDFLIPFHILEFDDNCARAFGRLKSDLDRRKIAVRHIGLDLLIAATALAHDLTLVTNNTKDFLKIPGLRMVDWLTE